jgi:hypothetical protein
MSRVNPNRKSPPKADAPAAQTIGNRKFQGSDKDNTAPSSERGKEAKKAAQYKNGKRLTTS